MRRLVFSLTVWVGVVGAPALLDLEPRAHAGYQPVAGGSVSAVRLDVFADADVPDTPRKPNAHVEPEALHHPAPGGATTSVQVGPGGNGPPPGLLPPADLPPAEVVAYVREPAGRRYRFRFIESVLDPPRPG